MSRELAVVSPYFDDKKKYIDEKIVKKAKREDNDDIAAQTRQNIWRSMLRPEHANCANTVVIPCTVCNFNQMQWNGTHHMAHIVARMHGGNNVKAWNRLPVCAACNTNAPRGCNLFDFCMLYHPDKVVAIALHLKNQLAANEPVTWINCMQDLSLEQLMRYVFGKPSHWTRKPMKEMWDFIREHVGEQENGKIENEHVYAALRIYDNKAKEIKQIQSNIVDTEIMLHVLQTNLAIAQRDLQSFNFTYSSSSSSSETGINS